MEERNEAKEATMDIFDEAMDKVEAEQTAEESSTEIKDEATETETEETSEDTTSQKSEEGSKEETELPKGFADHPAWQRIIKERDEARAKLQNPELGSDVRAKLDEISKITETPAFIQASMSQAGYSQEAINQELTKRGYNPIGGEETDLDYILKKFGVDKNNLDEAGQQYVNTQIVDIVNVANALIEKKFGSKINDALNPIQSTIADMTAERKGNAVLKSIENTVNDEGVLDYKKDVEPEIAKFLDENEQKGASLDDLKAHIDNVTRRLTIDRLRTLQGKSKRDERKGKLNTTKPIGSTVDLSNMPSREEGENVSDYTNRLLDSIGIE